MLKTILDFAAALIGIVIVGGILLVVGVGSSDSDVIDVAAMLSLILILTSPFTAAAYAFYRRKGRLRKRFSERLRLIESVDQHRSALTRNIERYLKRNDYGAIVADHRTDALEEFFASIDLDLSVVAFSEAIEVVYEQLDLRTSEDLKAGFDANNLPFDGHAFEQWVADALMSFGWEADLTQGSGDQGIDVVATKNGKKLGLQCKLYSSSVGNKAVQEAHAGKAFYDLDAVGVLTNAGFTASAKDLAVVTSVGLFSHRDIPNLYERVFG